MRRCTPETRARSRPGGSGRKVLQTGVAFHTDKVAFDVGRRAHQGRVLADREKVCQEVSALVARVVVDVDRSAERVVDEVKEESLVGFSRTRISQMRSRHLFRRMSPSGERSWFPTPICCSTSSAKSICGSIWTLPRSKSPFRSAPVLPK